MRRFVLDASIALAWCFEDESRASADLVLHILEGAEAVVPAIWHMEIGNSLLNAERRGRIGLAGTTRSLAHLKSLPIRVDNTPVAVFIEPLIALARERKLSVYDAGYLELAMREGIALATLDGALKRAAVAVGVRLLPDRPNKP